MLKKALVAMLMVSPLLMTGVWAGPASVAPIQPSYQSLFTMFGGTAAVKLNADGSATRVGEATVLLQGSGYVAVVWSDIIVDDEEVDAGFATILPDAFGKMLIQHDQSGALSVQSDTRDGNVIWWFDGRDTNSDGNPNTFEQTGATTMTYHAGTGRLQIMAGKLALDFVMVPPSSPLAISGQPPIEHPGDAGGSCSCGAGRCTVSCPAGFRPICMNCRSNSESCRCVRAG